MKTLPAVTYLAKVFKMANIRDKKIACANIRGLVQECFQDIDVEICAYCQGDGGNCPSCDGLGWVEVSHD